MNKVLLSETEVIAEIYIADSFIKRFLGFMFQKNPHHQTILIKPCNSIHTFFMRFNIDVLFVNDNLEVVKKLEDLEPGKAIMPQKNAKMVIEGEGGMFRNINVGDKVIVK